MAETTANRSDSAEVALIGAMILDPDALQGARRMVGPDDFQRDAHRVLYTALCAMLDAGQHVDVVTLTDHLATAGTLDHVGGAVALADLHGFEVCPVPAAWPSYATIVSREGQRRRMIAQLRNLIARLEAGEDPTVVAAALDVAA